MRHPLFSLSEVFQLKFDVASKWYGQKRWFFFINSILLPTHGCILSPLSIMYSVRYEIEPWNWFPPVDVHDLDATRHFPIVATNPAFVNEIWLISRHSIISVTRGLSLDGASLLIPIAISVPYGWWWTWAMLGVSAELFKHSEVIFLENFPRSS